MGLIGAVVGGLLGKASKKSKAKSENKDKASSQSSKELSLGSPPILLGGAAFAVLALVALARR